MNYIDKARILLNEDVELLTEKVRNITDKETKEKYASELYDMLKTTYKRAGIDFLSFLSVEDLINDSGMWKVVFRGGSDSEWGIPTAVGIYKDKLGRKRTAIGSEDSRQGSRDARKQLIKGDSEQNRAWGEVSGNMETHLLNNYGSTIFIPAKFAQEILNKNIIEIDDDGYHYIRNLKGTPHKKILWGVVDDDELVKKIARAKEDNPYIPLEFTE